MAKRKFLKQCF